MPLLHPDKIVGVTRAIQSRPVRRRPSIAVAAQRAVTPERQYLKKPAPKPEEPGLLENLAFALRDQHEKRHLERMARRADGAVSQAGRAPATGAGKPKPGRTEQELPAIAIHVNAPSAKGR